MLFAIEEINNSTDLLPGITLGYKIYDACGSISQGVRVALSLINGNEETASMPEQPCSGSVPAIMGPTSSSPCMAVDTVIGPFHTPMVKGLKHGRNHVTFFHVYSSTSVYFF